MTRLLGSRFIRRVRRLVLRRGNKGSSLYSPDHETLYFSCEELGMEGRRKGTDLQTRLTGLECLLDAVSSQQSVLDLGCAEGLVAREFCRRGCGKVVGFDLQKNSIQIAQKVFSAKSVEWNFRQGNLSDWEMFLKTNEDILDHQYDIVLLLGVYHHIVAQAGKRKAKCSLCGALELCRSYFAFRTNFPVPDRIFKEAGFQLIQESGADSNSNTGRLRIYKRCSLAN